jgi:hypothetical protein
MSIVDSYVKVLEKENEDLRTKVEDLTKENEILRSKNGLIGEFDELSYNGWKLVKLEQTVPGDTSTGVIFIIQKKENRWFRKPKVTTVRIKRKWYTSLQNVVISSLDGYTYESWRFADKKVLELISAFFDIAVQKGFIKQSYDGTRCYYKVNWI